MWGISYYLIGGLGPLIEADLHWSEDAVYGGFALALSVMGLASPIAGRAIDRYGGRNTMIVGSVLNALACVGLGLSHSLIGYYFWWICLGAAMRLTLYDAAFAALARIGGPRARGPMSQITLFGGLSSTVFWPIGHTLSEHFGWRNALFVYAVLAIATLPLHFALRDNRYHRPPDSNAAVSEYPLAVNKSEIIIASTLYVIITALTNFLNAAMSAQMIAILGGLGLATSTSVWIATLRGVGQSSARLFEILFGQNIRPLTLNLAATGILLICFIFGIFGGQYSIAAVAFALLYGIGNGVITITRGTMPLVLFDHRVYGTFVGKLITPSFLLSAAAPVIYASIMNHFGYQATFYLSILVAIIATVASAVLRSRFDERRRDGH
jgi:MFS family permease